MMFKKKNIIAGKIKEFISSVVELGKLEINLFLQESWEQIVPLIPLIAGVILSVVIFIISFVFFGFLIAAFFYWVTNSYVLSFLITFLLVFSLSMILFFIFYFKLKSYQFNLDKTKSVLKD